MERFSLMLDSAVKFQIIRQALAMADAIKDVPPRFTEELQIPVLTTDYRPAYLQNHFKNRSAFLVCGGPSLLTHDLSQLDQRGILTMAVNNAASVVRPQLWCCADPPYRFCRGIWEDPAIMKFLPVEWVTEQVELPTEENSAEHSLDLVSDMPNVFGYIRSFEFKTDGWLREPTVNYGIPQGQCDMFGLKGIRSVLMAALKLLFFLGVRRVYLLGCDFNMKHGKDNYAFEQSTEGSYIESNNKAYSTLNARLGHLKASFDEEGFHFFNCIAESGLTAFPHKTFEDAIAEATQPKHWTGSQGLYCRTKVADSSRPVLLSPLPP
ncbi:MAG: hypothetical protein AABP62_23825 [Planctomycetota bacterium]